LQDLEFRQFIERVKLRTPIEVVVGERVSALRKRGALYWACCPFHQEKTPSFAVDPRRATWRCYGACGEGGDVLSFVERFDGMSFLEALRLLARQCGEELPERSLRARAKGDEAALEARYELLRWAAETYRQAWRGPDAEEARAYMRRRGLGEPVLETFGIGWAGASGQVLVSAAQRDKKPLDWLCEAGLARRTDGGRAYDFFRGRVLIPIRDRLGRVVGFGGRLVGSTSSEASSEGVASAAPSGPKYLNTPETPLFHKGRVIFGLDLGANAIRSTHQLLVVEGYTDVMAAHQAGWKNAVAVLGTATTGDHAALVRRSGARSVVLVFDGDEAGRKASMRALAGLLELSVELRVAVLPEGRDPGDLLVDAAGAETFRSCVEGAREWFDWCLEGLRGKRGSELANAVEERFPLLARLTRPIERSARLAELARSLALPEADVRAQWAAYERAQRRAEPAEPAPPLPQPSARRSVPASAEQRSARAYALLLGALLQDNSLVPLYAHLAAGCPAELAAIFRVLLELYERDESGAPIDASAVMTALGDDPARTRVVALQTAAEEAESAAFLARDQARWIERARAEGALEALKSAALAPSGEHDDAGPAGGVDPTDALARLHRELRAGRVPTSKPASARSSP
jgi:DNA primase